MARWLLVFVWFFSATTMANPPVFDEKDIAALKTLLLSENNNLWEKTLRRACARPASPDDPLWEDVDWSDGVDGLTWQASGDTLRLTAIRWNDKGLTGGLTFEGFDRLRYLSCYNNRLHLLEARGLDSLLQLSCFGDSLAVLRLDRLPALKELYCFSNHLDSLSVQGLAALETLSCYKNKLTALDCSGMVRLSYLDCSSNRLSSLDLQRLPALSYLDCSLNQLDTLAINGLTGLTQLSCYSNGLTRLEIDRLTKLTYINCFFNKLSSLDVSHLPDLTYLSCWGNQIPFSRLPRLSIDEYQYEFQRIYRTGVEAGIRLDLSDLLVRGEITTYRYGNVLGFLPPDGTFIVPVDIRREGRLEIRMTNTAFPKFQESNLPLVLVLE